MMRRPFLPLLVLLGPILGASAVHAQTCLWPSRPGDPIILQQFTLVSRSTAWAIVGEPARQVDADKEGCMTFHLFVTNDSGQTWRDITPPSMPTRNIGQVFFLDASHVWMLSTDALADEPNTRFYLLSTQDGGKHWQTLVIERPTFHLNDDYYFPAQLYFIDSLHGWMVWQRQFMHSSQDALLATRDGGRSWRRLPNPPGAGPMQFLSTQDGWMIGGPEYWRGIDRPENTQLWVTHDGGTDWNPVAVPVPLDSTDQRAYMILFKFKNMSEGMVAAGAQAERAHQKYANCFTSDGGKTWHFSEFEALSAGPSIGDSHIFWCVGHRNEKRPRLRTVTFQKDTEPMEIALPEGYANQVNPLHCVVFIDDKDAWMRVAVERHTRLVLTTDGGETSVFFPLPLTTIK